MKRLLITTLAGAALAAASLAPAAAQSVPPGSYQSSCTNIRVRGSELIARCTNPQGAQVRSTLDWRTCRGGDIANSNGQLVCNGGGYGYNNGNNGRHRGWGYGNNNGNGYGRGNNNGYGYGRGNNNGYGYGRGNYGSVNGSYQQSCNNIQTRGSIITASCPGPNGQWMTTSINAAQCRGADIANRNGRLVCQ